MAFRYLIYRTDFGSTVVRESPTPSATGGTELELYTDFLIPTAQPLYYWRVSDPNVLVNNETNIANWEAYIALPVTPDALATIGQVTGYTTPLGNDIAYISGVTDMIITKLPYLSAGNYNLPSSFLDNGDGSATIGAIDVLLYPTTGFTGLIALYSVSGGTFTFTDNSEEYICAKYISPNNAVLIKLTNRNAFNNSDIVPIFTVWRLGNILNYFTFREIGRGLGNKTQESIVRTEPYLRAYKEGLIISEVETPFNRRILVTAAEVYTGAIKTDVLAYDSAINSLVMVYYSGGTITYQQQSGTSYNNTQYNTGVNLVNIPVGKFAVRWWYRPINHKKIMYYMLGEIPYDYFAQAYEAQPRLDLPIILKDSAMLIGRTIIQCSGTSGVTATAFDVASFGEAPIIIHNNTIEKQGTPLAVSGNEFYHLSQLEASNAILVPTIYQTLTGFTAYTQTTGLQQITNINAVTTNESTFKGGIVTGKIRPTGNTTTAIQIRKANGTTAVINVDTVSGFTGFGTTAPLGLVHAYGTHATTGTTDTQSNALIIDGSPNVDKDVTWSENGIPHWLAETYRDEESKYWYLYNVEADNSPLTIFESGRIGINKQTNILDYHSALVIGNGLNNMLVTGSYTQNYNIVYEVKISSTTGATDMFQWRKSIDNGTTYNGWSSDSGCTLSPITTELEFGVCISFETTTGHTTGNVFRFAAFAQIPQASLSLAPMGFQEVQKTQNYNASPIVYEDITTLANGGVYSNQFTIFESGTTGTIQAFYWGTKIQVHSIFFNLLTFGANLTLITEFWNGSIWVALDFNDNNYLDGTDNLSKSGRVIWTPNTMTNWNKSYIPDLVETGYQLYWMRIRTSTNPSIAPVAKSISVGNDKRFSIFNSFNDYRPGFYIDSLGRLSIGGGNISGSNQLQVNTANNLQIAAAAGTDSLVEFDHEDSSLATLKLKVASNDACGSGIDFSKTRGTLDVPLTMVTGDIIGRINFRGRVGTNGGVSSQISSQYTGNGSSTRCADLVFSTTCGLVSAIPVPIERVRITSSGTTGFGIAPTAVVHLKAGSTTIAPLKFTSGSLLSAPQIGAVEFLTDAYYGTITSGTARKTFAFLESPQFTGAPNLPGGATLNSVNLCNYIWNSGGTNNACKLNTSIYAAYTATTQTALITVITGVTNGICKYDCHNICLGGNLTSPVMICGDQDFCLQGKRLDFASSCGAQIWDKNGCGIELYSSGGTTSIKGMTTAGAESMRLQISDSQATFTDSRVTPRGLEYNGDYGITFNARSLVDKGYVDTHAGGLFPKASVMVATTAPITLSGLTIIGGVQLTTGIRVLVKNQSSGATNGVYSASTGIWGRTSDFDTDAEVVNGSYFFVTSGATNEDTAWILSTPNPIIVGTTSLLFTLFSASVGTVAGNGIYVIQSGGNYNVAIKLATGCAALCSDASGLYVNPSIAGTGLAYTNNTGVLSVCGANLAGNSLSWTGNSFNVNIASGTLSAALAAKLNTSTYSSYTGTTLNDINSRVLTTIFNTYTGTTAPALYQLLSDFNIYTGTTAPNTYYNKSQINSYTGATSIAIGLKANITSPTFTGIVRSVTPTVNDCSTSIATTAWYFCQCGTLSPIMDGIAAIGTSALWAHSDHVHPSDTSRLALSIYQKYTGTTAPATFANKAIFNAYTGTTAPATFASKSFVSTYTGTTAPATFVNKTTYQTYTGTTAPAAFASKSFLSTYTGTTAPAAFASKSFLSTYTGTTAPATFANKTVFNTYTGATRTELNLTITGATNLGSGSGIAAKSGRNISHKSLSGGTGIAISSTANAITICSTTSTIGADKQILYNCGGIVTGNTRLTYCTACDSIQIGSGSIASGALSFAIGGGQAIGANSFADGTGSVACAACSTILGGCSNTICSGALRSAIIGSCGISLTGATYSDYTAVGNLAVWATPSIGSISTDKTLFWNATDKKVKAIQLTGGSDNYHYKSCAIASGTTSSTCVKYLGYTASTFTAGRYTLDFSTIFGNSNSNACSLAQFNLDGTVVGRCFGQQLQYANNSTAGSLSRDVTLIAGTHCLDVWYWAGANTACIYYAMVRAKRIC
jgi:hypothetical protein